MTLFFGGMFAVVYVAGWKLGFGYEDASVAFNRMTSAEELQGGGRLFESLPDEVGCR